MKLKLIFTIFVLFILIFSANYILSQGQNHIQPNFGLLAQNELQSLIFSDCNEEKIFSAQKIDGFIFTKSASYIRGVNQNYLEKLKAFQTANNDQEKMTGYSLGWLGEAIKITVPYSFFMSKHLITNSEFAQFVAATGYITFVERYKTGYIVDHQAKWSQGVINAWRLTH